MKKELIQHIRKENKEPVATLVGVKDQTGCICIGYSKCHEKYDTFSKKKGVMIARGRARKDLNGRDLPFVVEDYLPYFVDRCDRFFNKEEE